jgi:hypothetical protein
VWFPVFREKAPHIQRVESGGGVDGALSRVENRFGRSNPPAREAPMRSGLRSGGRVNECSTWSATPSGEPSRSSRRSCGPRRLGGRWLRSSLRCRSRVHGRHRRSAARFKRTTRPERRSRRRVRVAPQKGRATATLRRHYRRGPNAHGAAQMVGGAGSSAEATDGQVLRVFAPSAGVRGQGDPRTRAAAPQRLRGGATALRYWLGRGGCPRSAARRARLRPPRARAPFLWRGSTSSGGSAS